MLLDKFWLGSIPSESFSLHTGGILAEIVSKNFASQADMVLVQSMFTTHSSLVRSLENCGIKRRQLLGVGLTTRLVINQELHQEQQRSYALADSLSRAQICSKSLYENEHLTAFVHANASRFTTFCHGSHNNQGVLCCASNAIKSLERINANQKKSKRKVEEVTRIPFVNLSNDVDGFNELITAFSASQEALVPMDISAAPFQHPGLTILSSESTSMRESSDGMQTSPDPRSPPPPPFKKGCTNGRNNPRKAWEDLTPEYQNDIVKKSTDDVSFLYIAYCFFL